MPGCVVSIAIIRPLSVFENRLSAKLPLKDLLVEDFENDFEYFASGGKEAKITDDVLFDGSQSLEIKDASSNIWN